VNTAPPIVTIRSLGRYDPAEEAAGYVLSGLPGARDIESMPESWKIVELLLRETLAPLGAAHGKNPLSTVAPRGGTIAVKPNFVRHFNECPSAEPEAVVTSWTVLYPLIDMALDCVGREGRVVLADAPMHDCLPERILERGRFREVVAHYARAGYDLCFIDLRQESWRVTEGVIRDRVQLAGDPAGYVVCDLGTDSEFEGLGKALRRLRGTSFDDADTRSHHAPGRHEYLISKTILSADLILNVARLKTHGKIGITAATKNIVGINGNKNCLPHWRSGFPRYGGDQYPSMTAGRLFRYIVLSALWPFLRNGSVARIVSCILGAVHRTGIRGLAGGGAWHGNDTTWRMVCDLNKALVYCDSTGKVHPERMTRSILHIVDAVEAGQGEGPLGPEPVRTGFTGCSTDPVMLDAACMRLVGIDPSLVPYIVRASRVTRLPFSRSGGGSSMISIDGSFSQPDGIIVPRARLRPPSGWHELFAGEGESD